MPGNTRGRSARVGRPHKTIIRAARDPRRRIGPPYLGQASPGVIDPAVRSPPVRWPCFNTASAATAVGSTSVAAGIRSVGGNSEQSVVATARGAPAGRSVPRIGGMPRVSRDRSGVGRCTSSFAWSAPGPGSILGRAECGARIRFAVNAAFRGGDAARCANRCRDFCGCPQPVRLRAAAHGDCDPIWKLLRCLLRRQVHRLRASAAQRPHVQDRPETDVPAHQ